MVKNEMFYFSFPSSLYLWTVKMLIFIKINEFPRILWFMTGYLECLLNNTGIRLEKKF